MIRTRINSKTGIVGNNTKAEEIEAPTELVEEIRPETLKLYAKLEPNSNLVNSFYCSIFYPPAKKDICVIEKKFTHGAEREYFIHENNGLTPFEEVYKPTFWTDEDAGLPMFCIHKYKIVDGKLQETTIEDRDKESLPMFYNYKISYPVFLADYNLIQNYHLYVPIYQMVNYL